LQEEGQDSDDARPSGGAWCLTALMAFMAMLLIPHLFELFYSEQAHQPGKGPSADPQASAGMLLVWLTVRFLVILIPMYAVLRVMHTVRDQQMQQDTDRDLEQELAALLWVSASTDRTDDLSNRPFTKLQQLPNITFLHVRDMYKRSASCLLAIATGP